MERPDSFNAPAPVAGPENNLVGKVHEALATLVERLEAGTGSEADVLTALNLHQRLKEVTKGLGYLVDDAAVQYINKHGDITCGNIRYYVGTTTYTKCKDVKGTLEMLMAVSGGDFGAMAECLASDAWKAGQSRVVLGDKFDTCFSTEKRMELKDGKPLAPKKSLQKVNMDFQPKKLKGKS